MEAVQVGEEALHPLDVDLVVVPPLADLLEHVLAGLSPDGRQDHGRQVVGDGLLVPLVELLRVVVRRLLRAHVVHQREVRHVLLVVELVSPGHVVLQDLVQRGDGPILDLAPALLKLYQLVVHRPAIFMRGAGLEAQNVATAKTGLPPPPTPPPGSPSAARSTAAPLGSPRATCAVRARATSKMWLLLV